MDDIATANDTSLTSEVECGTTPEWEGAKTAQLQVDARLFHLCERQQYQLFLS